MVATNRYQLTLRSIITTTMNDYDIYTDHFDEDDFIVPHLPLDWNEDLSLEEYLERMERNANAIIQPSK